MNASQTDFPLPTHQELHRMTPEQFETYWAHYAGLIRTAAPSSMTIKRSIALKRAKWILVEVIHPGPAEFGGSAIWFRWREPFSNFIAETDFAHARFLRRAQGLDPDGPGHLVFNRPIVQGPKPPAASTTKAKHSSR